MFSDICLLYHPCFPGVECTSHSDGSWECGSCPLGLNGNGTHCEDENEVKGAAQRFRLNAMSRFMAKCRRCGDLKTKV